MMSYRTAGRALLVILALGGTASCASPGTASTASAGSLPVGASDSAGTRTPLPATIAQSVPTPRPTPSAPQPVEGTLSEYSISLSTLTAQPGTVHFALSNTGQRKHDIRVVGNGVDKKMRDLAPGQSGTLDVTFVDPGPYRIYCDVADHADHGMELTFTVE